MNAQQAFLTAMLDTSREATAELREQVEKLADAATALQNYDVDAAWAKIEKAAGQIVEKARKPLSEAQAVERVLRERPELYDAYRQAHDARLDSIEKARNTTALRGLAEAAEEQLATIVRKGIDLGLTEDEAVDQALELRPDLVAAAGGEVPQVVEKGAATVHEIDRAARALMSRDPSLSIERATDQVLRADPSLYRRYLEEIRGGDQAGDDDPAEDDWPPKTGSTSSRSPLDNLRPRQRVAKTTLVSEDGRWSATVDEHDAQSAGWWQRLWAGNARIEKEMSR